MINIFIKTDPETRQQLDRMEATLLAILQGNNAMGLDLARIQTEVTENNAIIGSAVALINQIAQDIRDNVANQEALNALADQLDAQSGLLADAVTANTPAAPAGAEGTGGSPAAAPTDQPVV